MENITVKFELNKVTKNTIRFEEVLSDVLATPQIGVIYIPKRTLQAIGYVQGKQLVLTLSAE